MKTVDIYHDGRLVFGFEVTYANESNPSKKYQVGHHIGGHVNGDVQCSTFAFEEGEYINSFSVNSGDLVDKVAFVTNKGREFSAGGNGGGKTVAVMEHATKPRVIAIGGGLGGHMHHLRVHYVESD